MGRIFNLDSPLSRFLSRMADLMWLNILALVCCIPIFTIGASLTALNYVALKMVRNEEGYIRESFFKSFKQNFKQATLIWLIMLAALILLACDFYIIRMAPSLFPDWIKAVLFAITMLLLIGTMYVFPVLARFENNTKDIFKNSLFMGILSLPKTILMVICWIIPVAIGLVFYQILPLALALGMSLPAYGCALLYNKTFKRFEPEEEQTIDEEWTLPSEEEQETKER